MPTHQRPRECGGPRRLGAGFLAGLLGLTAAACDAQDLAQHYELGSISRTYEAPAELDALELSVRAGLLEIAPSADERVHVTASLSVTEALRARLGGEPLGFEDHARVEFDGGRMTVEDLHRGADDEQDWQVSFQVRLPVERVAAEGLDLRARLGAGRLDLRLPALDDLDAEVGFGELGIDVERLAGPVDLDMGAGELRLAVASEAPRERVAIELGTGEILLRLPEDVDGDFDVESAVGEVEVDSRYGVATERSLASASLKGRVGAGTPPYVVRVGFGSCALR